jgi:hypothetical protein
MHIHKCTYNIQGVHKEWDCDNLYRQAENSYRGQLHVHESMLKVNSQWQPLTRFIWLQEFQPIEEIYSGYRLMINGKGKDNIQENL